MKNYFRIIKLALLIIVEMAIISQASGQETIQKANFKLAEQWTVAKQYQKVKDIWKVPGWVNGTDMFFYKHSEEGRYSYYLVDPHKKEVSELCNQRDLKRLLESILDTSLQDKSIDMSIREVNQASNYIRFTFNRINFEYNTLHHTLDSIKQKQYPVTNDNLILSPDSGLVAFIRENNLFLSSNKSTHKDTIQITHDGRKNLTTGLSNVLWSPDSRYLVFIREDWQNVKELWLVNHYTNPRPSLETYKWPVPGEEVEQYELWIYDTKAKMLFKVKTDKWQDQTLSEIRWRHDSRKIYFLRQSRDWMNLDLCSVNLQNGECSVVIEERGKRQIINRQPYHLLELQDKIIWWSWRDGWNHYYLYDHTGKLENQITKGSFNAGEIKHIEEKNSKLFFIGNSKEKKTNPYYHHLYSATFNGENLILLTPENAEHEIYFSPSGTYFIDNYSRADLAPHAVVRDLSGKLIMELEASDISSLKNAGWQEPEIFHVKAADDSTDIWGVMFKPYDFDPGKKYPVISYGYPGKESEFLPWRYYHNGWITSTATSLAQYGFIVVVAGNRGGSAERSYSYYNYGENNFRDYAIADKKRVIEHLGAMHQYIDMDRIGIMGQSSGGYMAATAILLEPDFFKVAVAKNGPHDPGLYYHHWAERYTTTTKTTHPIATDYQKEESNNQLVNNLKGKLLLVQGDMDLNVPPSLTYRLAYDLMMANKRFEMFIIPKADHYWGDNYQYVIKYIELYFVENLMENKYSPSDLD